MISQDIAPVKGRPGVRIGQNLRAARNHRGLTQKELAARIGRAQTTVSQAESGRIPVSLAYVRDVLKACGCPRNWSRWHPATER